MNIPSSARPRRISREAMRSPAAGSVTGSTVTAGVATVLDTPGGAAMRPAMLPLQLVHQVVHHALEWIETKRGGHRRAQVRVGVDVVEHAPATRSVQILDPAHRKSGCLHDPVRGANGIRRDFRKR